MMESSNRSQRWISDEIRNILATDPRDDSLIPLASYACHRLWYIMSNRSTRSKEPFRGISPSLLREFGQRDNVLSSCCNLVHIRSLSLNYMSIDELKNDLDVDQSNLNKDVNYRAISLNAVKT